MPLYKFLNALLRKNRKYYKGEESNFVNLFSSNYNDDMPDPFVRVDILYWLNVKNVEEGPTKVKGMFPVCDILRDLQFVGHKVSIIHRELNYLVKRGLILSETLSNNVEKGDLVKIALPGLLHLKLLKNVTYLAACAEDVLFRDANVMTTISRRLASNSYTTKTSMALTASELIRYLSEYKKDFCSYPEEYISEENRIELFDLNECKTVVERWIEDDLYVKEGVNNIEFYKPGTSVLCTVENKNNGALICFFGNEGTIKGFISAVDGRYQLDYSEYENINEGDILYCEVLEYDYSHKSFQLKYIAKNDCEDVGKNLGQ